MITGLTVTMNRACRCGSTIFQIEASNRLACADCGQPTGLISDESKRFLERTTILFGRPVKPITVRTR